MKRLIVVALAALILAGGLITWRTQASGPTPTPTPAAAASVDTRNTIRAKGVVVPARQTKLAFRAGGQVQSVAVKPGDEVKAGQVIATLDARDLDLAVKVAQDSLTLAQLGLEQAKRAAIPEEIAAAEAAIEASEAQYQELTKGSARSDVLAAESALATARQQLAQAEASASADERIARANLDSAKAKLAQLQAQPRPEDVRSAELQIEQAKLNLWSAQIARDGLAGAAQRGMAMETDVKAREAQLAAMELMVETARQNLAKVKAGPPKEELAAAQAAVDQAQAQLDAKLATRDQTLASARSGIAAAQARLEKVKAGSTEAELKIAQSGIARDRAALVAKRGDGDDLELRTAKVKVTQAETALAQAQLALEGARLSAPYDGAIADVLVSEHDTVAPGTAAVVFADLRTLQVESTDLDQASVAKLAVEQPVKVTFYAFEDKALAGRIVRIASIATTSETGEVSYPVVVALDQRDSALRWGMTTRLEFQTEYAAAR